MKCHCINIDFGTYNNTVGMILPYDIDDCLMSKKKGHTIYIDTCIASEIGYLWHQGVETLNSCCGHNKGEPTVIVKKESIPIMERLGYECAKKWANPTMTFYLKGM